MREPGNHDNGASDVWALTAYYEVWVAITGVTCAYLNDCHMYTSYNSHVHHVITRRPRDNHEIATPRVYLYQYTLATPHSIHCKNRFFRRRCDRGIWNLVHQKEAFLILLVFKNGQIQPFVDPGTWTLAWIRVYTSTFCRLVNDVIMPSWVI